MEFSHCSIVILGGWNTRILIPPWLGNNIFQKQELEIRFPIDPTLPFIVSDRENYSMEVSNTRLVFQPVTACCEKIKIAAEGAQKVLDILPHTPISAVGINFSITNKFKEEVNYSFYREIQKHMINVLGDEVEFAESSVNRKFILGKKYQNREFNFKVSLKKDDNVLFDMNFHKDIVNQDSVKQVFELIDPASIENLYQYTDSILLHYICENNECYCD